MQFFYKILQQIAHILFRIFFKRIFLRHWKDVPAHEPTIIVGNHANAAMEGILLSVFYPRPVYLLTRGDLFANRFVEKMLAFIHLLPIYRQRDGIGNVQKNFQIFDTVQRALKENAVIVIFAEGNCIQEKRLRSLQKGAARLAFQFAQETAFQKELFLQPMGINYTYPAHLRGEVMLAAGKAIRLSDYFSLYQENDRKAITALTQNLAENLAPEVLQLTPETEAIFEKTIPTLRKIDDAEKQYCGLVQYQDVVAGSRLEMEQNWANFVQTHSAEAVDTAIKHKKLTVEAAKKGFSLRNFLCNGFYYVCYLFSLLIFVIPLFFAHFISKAKVKEIEFFNTTRFTLTFLLSLVFWALVLGWILMVSLVFRREIGYG
ncbi:MAG: 1-acyl-sn-glycerol-3-phosphate acyltransferase [Bacteroidetes bacterium]|nr:1-acyl-sn-glycerol-3-phosphate acyltransferase [Bacteroidota bacterium]MCB9043368.1 1-acyl-sn-glycerol-3-phosphate acyltransferase [Chitinophagales bacterium]